MAKRLKSVKAVVEHLGGVEAVALLTKRHPQNVYNWIALRRFSATTFLVMRAALRTKGASASPKLWRMEGKVEDAA